MEHDLEIYTQYEQDEEIAEGKLDINSSMIMNQTIEIDLDPEAK